MAPEKSPAWIDCEALRMRSVKATLRAVLALPLDDIDVLVSNSIEVIWFRGKKRQVKGQVRLLPLLVTKLTTGQWYSQKLYFYGCLQFAKCFLREQEKCFSVFSLPLSKLAGNLDLLTRRAPPPALQLTGQSIVVPANSGSWLKNYLAFTCNRCTSLWFVSPVCNISTIFAIANR